MRRVIGVTTVAACLLASAAAAAPLPPDQACRVAKLLASGAEVAARLQCEARHLATGESAACAANAAARRDEAFAHAEARGGCPTTGDSEALGAQAAVVVQNVLSKLRPDGPTASRCTKRLVALSARAALRRETGEAAACVEELTRSRIYVEECASQ